MLRGDCRGAGLCGQLGAVVRVPAARRGQLGWGGGGGRGPVRGLAARPRRATWSCWRTGQGSGNRRRSTATWPGCSASTITTHAPACGWLPSWSRGGRVAAASLSRGGW